MLLEAAERGEDAVGLVPLSVRDGKDGSGGNTRQAARAAAGDGGARQRNKVPAAVDEDRDVRELESMLMGLEAEEEDYENIPFAELTADGEAELAEAAASADKEEEDVEACIVVAGEGAERSKTTPESPPAAASGIGEGNRGSGATMPGANDGVDSGSRNTSPAFTIGEDVDEGDAGRLQASTTETTSPPPIASASDLESTEALLGSIADTLTPAADAGDGDPESDAGRPLLATRSELALVNLMEEAEQKPGVLAGAGESRLPGGGTSESSLRSSSGGIGGAGDGGAAGRHPNRGGQSGFDDVLSVGSTAFGSSDAAGKGGVGSGSGTSVVGDGDGPVGETSRTGAVRPAAAAASYATGDDKTAAAGLSEYSAAAAGKTESAPPASPVFSLGHERWVTCGFTSAHTVGRRDEEDASVGRALRDASSVLALDSINYFLAR